MPRSLLPLPRSVKPAPGTALDLAEPSLRGTVLWWPLNEGVGRRCADSSGNGRTGTFDTNPPSWAAGPPGNLAAAGTALFFAGDAARGVTVASNAGVGTSNATFACWLRAAAAAQKGPAWVVGSEGLSNGYSLGVGNNSLTDLSSGKLVAKYVGVRNLPTGVSLGTDWAHAVLVVDGSGHPTVYLNGVSVYSDTSTGPSSPTAATYLGESPGIAGGARWTGSIADFRIWNRPLTAGEVLALYLDSYAGFRRGGFGLFMPPVSRPRPVITVRLPHPAAYLE